MTVSPIKLSPEVPIQISATPETISSSPAITDALIVRGLLYVLPAGKPLDYIVEIKGFAREPGGMLETQRLTTGHKCDNITLTTEQDQVLNSELGVEAIRIDKVLYEAVND
jgi:hypothetical protein